MDAKEMKFWIKWYFFLSTSRWSASYRDAEEGYRGKDVGWEEDKEEETAARAEEGRRRQRGRAEER